MRGAGRIAMLVTALTPLLTAGALAQQPGFPTTIQLPTLSSFSVQTSVSVPDSGGAYTEAARLARMRASNGLRPAGANSNRAMPARPGQGGIAWQAGAAGRGSSAAAQSASDARIGAHGSAESDGGNFARALSAARQSSAGQPAPSVARLKAIWLAQRESSAAEAATLLAEGDRALAAGKPGAAKAYYERAARQNTGAARQEAVARLKALSAGANRDWP